MTSMSLALQRALRPECELKIACKIVDLVIYRNRNGDAMTILYCDEDGCLLETFTMNKRRMEAIYGNFHVNQSVVLTCLANSVLAPDGHRSQTRYVIEHNWSLARNRAIFDDREYFKCFTDIKGFHSDRRKTKMLAGILVEIGAGSLHRDTEGQVVAESTMLKLKDARGFLFSAKVWGCASDLAGPVAQVQHPYGIGDQILLPLAKEDQRNARAGQPNIYRVTTSYPPVVNSSAVAEYVRRQLEKAARLPARGYYNPYAQEEKENQPKA